MKFGYQGGYLSTTSSPTRNDQFVAFRFNNGVPNQITENINPFPPQQRVRYDSFYAQEQWTLRPDDAAGRACGTTAPGAISPR